MEFDLMAVSFSYWIKRNGVKTVRQSLAAIKKLANEEADRTGKAVTIFFDSLEQPERGRARTGRGKLPVKGTYQENPAKKASKTKWDVEGLRDSWFVTKNGHTISGHTSKVAAYNAMVKAMTK